MRGSAEILIDRSPDFFRLYDLFDPDAHVWVAECASGVEGCLAILHDTVQVPGAVLKIGYLRDFKISPTFRNGVLAVRLIREAVRHERALGTQAVLASILEGNEQALIFTAGRARLPKPHRLGPVRYYTVAPLFPKKLYGGVRIEPWRVDFIPAVQELFRETLAATALQPVDSAALISKVITLPHLDGSDIFTAWKGENIVGMVVAWDYEAITRYVVSRFSCRLSIARALLMTASVFMPTVRPPRRGKALRHRFVLAFAAANTEGLDSVLAALHNGTREGPWSHYGISLHGRDPLCAAIQGIYTSHIRSELFLFPDRDVDLPFDYFNQRPIYPGVATYL